MRSPCRNSVMSQIQEEKRKGSTTSNVLCKGGNACPHFVLRDRPCPLQHEHQTHAPMYRSSCTLSPGHGLTYAVLFSSCLPGNPYLFPRTWTKGHLFSQSPGKCCLYSGLPPCVVPICHHTSFAPSLSLRHSNHAFASLHHQNCRCESVTPDC